MRGIQVLLAMRDLAISEEQQEVIVAGICVAVGKRHIPLGGQADAIGLAGYIVETKTDGAGRVGKQLFEIGEPRLFVLGARKDGGWGYPPFQLLRDKPRQKVAIGSRASTAKPQRGTTLLVHYVFGPYTTA